MAAQQGAGVEEQGVAAEELELEGGELGGASGGAVVVITLALLESEVELGLGGVDAFLFGSEGEVEHADPLWAVAAGGRATGRVGEGWGAGVEGEGGSGVA